MDVGRVLWEHLKNLLNVGSNKEVIVNVYGVRRSRYFGKEVID